MVTNPFSKIGLIIHWFVAIGIISLIFAGLIIHNLADDNAFKSIAMYMHKAFGIIILAIALPRFIYRLFKGLPEAVSDSTPNPFFDKLAHLIQWALLLGAIIIPIAGIMLSRSAGYDTNFFGLFTIPGLSEKNEGLQNIASTVHELVAFLVLALASIHAIGAIKHHFIDKDSTLKRIIGKE